MRRNRRGAVRFCCYIVGVIQKCGLTLFFFDKRETKRFTREKKNSPTQAVNPPSQTTKKGKRDKNLHLAKCSLGIVPTPLRDLSIKLVLAREDTSRDGVIGVKGDVEVFEARKEFVGDVPFDGVVGSLVDGREDVTVLFAD